ncbi:MAG: C40 family peptidase [Burkholderiales bacterium]|nr:C40 family peptidase [Burkholderiales bacterium]
MIGRIFIQRIVLLVVVFAAGCGGVVVKKSEPIPSSAQAGSRDEVVLYALGLMDTDYRFGGKNPSSGFDCSGMVSYIYKNAVGMNLPHNAYRIAQISKKIEMSQIRPGDLVFFDTQHRPFSHVGIYIGNGKFVHAPGSNGKIRIGTISSGYFAKRLDGAGTLF